MLKLTQLIKEYKMDKMSPFDKKVLKLIHKQILDSYIEENNPDSIDNYTVDELVEDVDLIKDIYDFLNDTMELDSSSSQAFIDLLVSNFNVRGDYDDLENPIYIPKEQKYYEKIYTEYAGVTPYLIEDVDQSGQTLPVVYDAYNNQHYMIGQLDVLEGMVRDYFWDTWWGDDEIINAIGEDVFIDYLEVGKADARMMASEEARHLIEDMSDRELLDRLEDMNSSLRNEYDSLENEINDIEEWGVNKGKKSVKELEKKKDGVIDRARDMLREEHYDHTYEMITEDLKEWLWEYGYITQAKHAGYFQFSDHLRTNKREGMHSGGGVVNLDKLPIWLEFNKEAFIDSEVNEAMQVGRFEMLSDSGDSASEVTHDGDTYYIIDIDY